MAHRLRAAEHIEWLTGNVEFIAAAATQAPDTAVPACPGWTCLDVAGHVMRGFPVYSAFLQRDSTSDPQEAVRAEATASNEWASGVENVPDTMRQQCAAFVELAAGLEPRAEALFWDGPGTVAKMLWHGAAESWIHTHDVAAALGEARQLSPGQAADLLEWSAMFRRMVVAGRGLDSDSTVTIESTDTSQAETLGRGEPVAVIRGSAVALSLRLWNRSPDEHLHGDGVALSAWADVALTSPLG